MHAEYLAEARYLHTIPIKPVFCRRFKSLFEVSFVLRCFQHL